MKKRDRHWTIEDLDEMIRREPPWPRVAQSPDEQFAYPNYTDDRWLTARLIYGCECKTTEGNYSDQLWQWDSEAAKKASDACLTANLQPRTARWTEAWLSAYHGRPVILRYILGGVNHSSGYEYYVHGYDYQETTP